MIETKVLYPYRYFHHTVCTVALYGSQKPRVFNGKLVLRTYYTDENMRTVDTARTSAYVKDEIFFETNKVLREMMDDPYNGKRVLNELPMPELGTNYVIIYNSAEIPSVRCDDQIATLRFRDPEARGVAIILKRDHAKGLTWLTIEEARWIRDQLSAE